MRDKLFLGTLLKPRLSSLVQIILECMQLYSNICVGLVRSSDVFWALMSVFYRTDLS